MGGMAYHKASIGHQSYAHPCNLDILLLLMLVHAYQMSTLLREHVP